MTSSDDSHFDSCMSYGMLLYELGRKRPDIQLVVSKMETL